MVVVYQMFSLVKHLFFMILSEKVNKSLILDEETDCQGTEKILNIQRRLESAYMACKRSTRQY